MNSAAELHSKAMALYEAALASRRTGNDAAFREGVEAALHAESQAAHSFAKENGAEPTRSVLFRSAATIAMMGCEFDRALELASSGLTSSSTPKAIRAELVALVKDANYRLHVLETEGVTIGDESITLSLEGEAVGNGMVRQDVFKTKLNSLINIINRTIDRMSGVSFGEARTKELSAPLFVSPPIPGSFGIEVHLGDQKQPDLTGLPQKFDVDAVLDEVVECFDSLKKGDLEALHKRIPNEDYFVNFVGNGRQLQPDGTKITAVELIGKLHKGIKRVRITTPKPRPARRKNINDDHAEIREVTGLLRVASKRDEGKEQVEIVDDDGKWHVVHVPASLMADVVRPLWDSRVTISGHVSKRDVIELETIDPA